jgi:site-specific DNA-methyltransferase (adenine-specific)
MSGYEVMVGDCLTSLRLMSDCSVHTCITSPPYFGLRDYGHAGQIGLEDTPEAYVARLVEVFREVRRVLRDDGTLWLNLGDSYASTPPGNSTKGVSGKSGLNGVNGASGKYRETLDAGHATKRDTSKLPGLKPKDLIGVPWRVAFALQADGWYLRQEIIWNKPNPMPESVRDRFTKAHEYVFLLSKSARYYFDQDAVKEPAVGKSLHDLTGPGYSAPGQAKNKGNRKALRSDIESRHRSAIQGGQSLQACPDGTRNRRSVWTVTTKPYAGAHFATFPPDLIEPCVLAGCPVGGTVLDPFGGSGTTAGVAVKHGRNAILCELNPNYAALVPDRVAKIAGPMSTLTTDTVEDVFS